MAAATTLLIGNTASAPKAESAQAARPDSNQVNNAGPSNGTRQEAEETRKEFMAELLEGSVVQGPAGLYPRPQMLAPIGSEAKCGCSTCWKRITQERRRMWALSAFNVTNNGY